VDEERGCRKNKKKGAKPVSLQRRRVQRRGGGGIGHEEKSPLAGEKKEVGGKTRRGPFGGMFFFKEGRRNAFTPRGRLLSRKGKKKGGGTSGDSETRKQKTLLPEREGKKKG